jgi:hypothetical protein
LVRLDPEDQLLLAVRVLRVHLERLSLQLFPGARWDPLVPVDSSPL